MENSKPNYKRIITPTLILLGFILMHKSIERNSFDMGFSWTASKILPYALTFVAILILAIQIGLVFRKLEKWKNHLLKTTILLALSGFAFALQPIYEGDFSHKKQMVDKSPSALALNKGLTMLALPNCPFCKERIPTINLLQNRNPNLNIQILLLNASEEATQFYQNRLLEEIQVLATQHANELAEIAFGRFPSFLFVDNEGQLYSWTNDGFGTLALNWVENNH